jgi:two-component sensor histidine kinase
MNIGQPSNAPPQNRRVPAQDAETQERLLHEINHRVKNNLAAILGLLYAERRNAIASPDRPLNVVLTALIARVQGLATTHRLLSRSCWAPLKLSELAAEVVEGCLNALCVGKHLVTHVTPCSIHVSPKQANSLALVISELVTNTLKHAMSNRDSGRIDIALSHINNIVLLLYKDDGPGYSPRVLSGDQAGVGLSLVRAMVANDLGGTLTLANEPGAAVRIRFGVSPASQEYGFS